VISENDRRSARADRRLVGVDLGIASDHTVRVLRGDGSEVCRRRACPTVESLTRLETAALVGAPVGTRLEVVIEPTGPAWLPVAVFFTSRGHRVFRVASAKAADLRRFLSRHAKSNGIDADTLARLPLLAPGSLQPLELPGCEAAALDRRVRACDRLTQQGALHQRRIKDLVRQLMPVTPLTGELTKTDLAVLAHWADPRALLAAGRSRLLARITKTSHGQQGAARTDAWRAAAQAAVDLYGEHPAVAYSDLAAEVLTEVRLLTAVRAELVGHAEARADAYRWTDPARLAASLPGLAEVGAPTVTAIVGRAARFRTGKGVPLLYRAGAPGQRDRRDRPQGPADE
jgi:transposase